MWLCVCVCVLQNVHTSSEDCVCVLTRGHIAQAVELKGVAMETLISGKPGTHLKKN